MTRLTRYRHGAAIAIALASEGIRLARAAAPFVWLLFAGFVEDALRD